MSFEFQYDLELDLPEHVKEEMEDFYRRDNYRLNEYQDEVEDLVITRGQLRLVENTLGLVGEAGEVAEKIKKYYRDGVSNEEDIIKELGDVLFYVAALSNFFDSDLSEVALKNLEKLKDRKARGKIKGSGDDR